MLTLLIACALAYANDIDPTSDTQRALANLRHEVSTYRPPAAGVALSITVDPVKCQDGMYAVIVLLNGQPIVPTNDQSYWSVTPDPGLIYISMTGALNDPLHTRATSMGNYPNAWFPREPVTIDIGTPTNDDIVTIVTVEKGRNGLYYQRSVLFMTVGSEGIHWNAFGMPVPEGEPFAFERTLTVTASE